MAVSWSNFRQSESRRTKAGWHRNETESAKAQTTAARRCVLLLKIADKTETETET